MHKRDTTPDGALPEKHGRKARPSRKWSGVLLGYLGVISAFFALWLPEFREYWITAPEPSDQVVEQARKRPPQSLLQELGAQSLAVRTHLREPQLIEAANRVLHGRLELPRFPPVQISVPFDEGNLDVGLPTVQLLISSLTATELLLGAYSATRDEKYFSAAREDLIAFARVERSQFLPRGMLRNDHAVAARIPVLIRFWDLYRDRHDFDPETARSLLILVARSAELLSAPSQFTYRTNHGVMQSLALLQIAAAFPMLEGASGYKELGCSRLVDQMRYYIDSQGVTLEHSSGYHALGQELLGMAVRLFQINGCDIPDDWEKKRVKADQFANLLRRPDGTFPAIGDTDHAPDFQGTGALSRPDRPTAVFPLSGYAVWWDGLESWPQAEGLSQTVVTWSNFPTRAHKLADDMSVVIWGRGAPWITNTGYWPYGVRGRHAAESWLGSNAPHLFDEPAQSTRETTLRAFGEAKGLRAIELERRTEGNVRIRRQVVGVDGTNWWIVDSVTDPQARVLEVSWTGGPELGIERLPDGDFLLRRPTGTTSMRMSFLGEPEPTVDSYRGNWEPFAGWIVLRGQPVAAPAVMLKQPSRDSWAMSVFALGSENAIRGERRPVTGGFESPEAWQGSVPVEGGAMTVTRKDRHVTLRRPDGGITVAVLEKAGDALAEKEALEKIYADTASRYPRFRNLMSYRIRISELFLMLLVLQEVFFLAARRVASSAGWVYPLRVVSGLAWLAGGLWLSMVYLR